MSMLMLSRAAFALRISVDVASLVSALYERFKGNPELARDALRQIPDHWADYDERRAARDQELERLKAEGR